MHLETGKEEDDRLLKQFEAKHKFFCDKASHEINEVADLNLFKE